MKLLAKFLAKLNKMNTLDIVIILVVPGMSYARVFLSNKSTVGGCGFGVICAHIKSLTYKIKGKLSL